MKNTPVKTPIKTDNVHCNISSSRINIDAARRQRAVIDQKTNPLLLALIRCFYYGTSINSYFGNEKAANHQRLTALDPVFVISACLYPLTSISHHQSPHNNNKISQINFIMDRSRFLQNGMAQKNRISNLSGIADSASSISQSAPFHPITTRHHPVPFTKPRSYVILIRNKITGL